MANVLGRIRLSNLTEESTSPERQTEVIQQWADVNGHTIVGWATDLNVSGSVDPFEAPEFGKWLKPEKASEWDIVVAYRLDRYGRRVIPLNKLFGYCIDNSKTLVSVSESIDLSTWVGRLIANVIAGVAEGELEAIKERTKQSRGKLLRLGRWPGGVVPYWCEKYKANPGYKLRNRPDRSKVVLRVIEDVIAGKSMEEIADDLKREGIKAASGNDWAAKSLWQILGNKLLLGYAMEDGEVVRDAKGNPVLVGEPLITYERWEELQHALELRRKPGSKRTRNTSRVLDVAKCLTCGGNYSFRDHNKKGKNYRYYWCRNLHEGQNQIPAESLESLLEDEFLAQVGDIEIEQKVFIPAESHEEELKASQSAIDDLTPLLATLASKSARERVTAQISALDARIAELEQLPSREATYELRGTGKTYREVWESSEWPDRRALLLRSNITLSARLYGRSKRPGEGGVFEAKLNIPEDIRKRMRQ